MSSGDTFSRLENLKTVRQWTWKETADALGLGVSAMMMLKSGKRVLSQKAMHRMEIEEIKAGIEVANENPDSPRLREDGGEGYEATLAELLRDLSDTQLIEKGNQLASKPPSTASLGALRLIFSELDTRLKRRIHKQP